MDPAKDNEFNSLVFDFYKMEYSRLMEELAEIRKKTADLERYAVIAISATYAWAFSHPQNIAGSLPILDLMFFIPPSLSGFFIIRRRDYIRGTVKISRYVAEIEQMLLSNSDPSYPGGVETRRAKTHPDRSSIWYGVSQTWVIVFVATLVVALWWNAR